MTTIAFDGEVIAYDSRETEGNIICDDNCDKRHRRGSVNFFIAGRSCDEELVVDAFLSEPQESYADQVCAEALAVKKGKVFEISIDKDSGYTCNLVRKGLATAIGSGAKHALTAMDCGLSAKEAVKMAMKRDAYTGGKIRTFKV